MAAVARKIPAAILTVAELRGVVARVEPLRRVAQALRM
jgi:hypothetical protein